MGRSLRNNKGVGALVLFIAVAIMAGVGLQTLLLLSKHYNNAKSAEKKSSEALSASEFSLQLTSMRFQISGNNLPLWYPETYPSQSELKATPKMKPLIQVLSPLQDKSHAMTIISEKIKRNDQDVTINFDLDRTRMGAVLNPSDSKSEIARGGSQSAYVSIGEFSKLNSNDLQQFLTTPTSSWPNIEGKLSNLENVKLFFDSYITETLPDSSVLIKGVTVIVERAGKRNTATFTIDAPPDPQCEITPVAGSSQPFVSGQTVQFNFTTTSITNSATFEGKSSPKDFSISTQSIKNLNRPTQVNAAGTFSVVVPDANTLPDTNADGTKKWIVKGSVVGVDSRHAPATCYSVALRVQPPVIDCKSPAAVVSNTTQRFYWTDMEHGAETYKRYVAIKSLFPTWDPYGRAGGSTGGVAFYGDDDTHLAMCNFMGYQSATGTRVTNRWRSPGDNGAMRFDPVTKQFKQVPARTNNWHTNQYDCIGKLIPSCYNDPTWIAKVPPPPPPPPPPPDCRSSAAIVSNTTKQFNIADMTTYSRYSDVSFRMRTWSDIRSARGVQGGAFESDNATHLALCNMMGYQSISGTRTTQSLPARRSNALVFTSNKFSYAKTQPTTVISGYECSGLLANHCYFDPTWISK